MTNYNTGSFEVIYHLVVILRIYANVMIINDEVGEK